ncbi:helicase-related protein [Paenibacillus sp. GYB004]|uniref:helicase-related protein n=1 Tax=Paenibacillus sp. GYB004 TaxID=2994393 RepID=UPI002F96A74A
MKISMNSVDRRFEAFLHLMIVEKSAQDSDENIIMASYLGIPEAVSAISAGFLEARTLQIGNEEFERNYDTYRRMERLIGIGDIAHGVVFNSLLTMDGIQSMPNSPKFNRSYLVAPDGIMSDVLAKHVIHRFGLPFEWENEFAGLLDHFLSPLRVIRNPDFNQLWPNLEAAVFTGTEESVLKVIEMALKNGLLQIPECDVQGVFDPSMSMKEYMVANAEVMARKLQEQKPRHSLEQLPIHRSIGEMKRIPFPAQAHMIQALVNTLEHEDSEFCSGDMGTGKSIVACGVANVLHQMKKDRGIISGTAVLLSAPSITISKWKNKEILGTLRGVKVEIIENSQDALRLLRKVKQGYRPTGLEFTLVGIDRAKLGPEPYFGGVWRRLAGSTEYAWHCPDCGRPLMVKDKDAEEGCVPARWSDFADSSQPDMDEIHQAREKHRLLPNGLPHGLKVKWRRTGRIQTCTYHEEGILKDGQATCRSKLWRPASWRRGETRNRPRENISRIFKRMNKYFDLYICDEAHQCKGESSGRGDAFAQMVKAAKQNLLLTGTLTNGKSSSIKEILWRTDPKALLDDGFDYNSGTIQWASRYGKLKQIVDVESDDTGWVTKQKQKPRQPTEEPGIAPQLTAQYLLHKAGFLELSDMGLPLVELKEIPIFLDMDPEHASKYSFFHNTLRDECMRRSKSGSKGAWSKFIPATINYADRPDLGGAVVFGFGEKCISAPAFEPESCHAKERQLIELVQKELAEGRRCVIYNNYTGEYQLNERIYEILTRSGIRCHILDEPDADNRAEVLAQLEEDEIPVIITNMKLVEVGLDLMYWPTIIYYQLNYEVSTVRQSSRRAWRLGQDRECRVYYLVYNRTQQMAQFMKIMAARGHALMVEGRLDRSELAKYSRDGQSSLAADLANCFAGSDVAKAWTELAAKDLEDVEMVNETEFKAVLEARMKLLVNETRRLCGLPPLDASNSASEEPEVHSVEMSEVLDLFTIAASVVEAPSEPTVQKDLLEMGLLKVVEISQYKKKRSRSTPAEGQLAFNF